MEDKKDQLSEGVPVGGEVSTENQQAKGVDAVEVQIKPKKLKLKFNKIKTAAVIGLTILLVTAVAAAYFVLNRSKLPNLNVSLTNKPLESQNANAVQFINCDDVRDVIEEEDKFYVACMGGVLVLDKDGKAINQITQTDGLGNYLANSIEKYDNTLYIGTQDGFTEFDLNTWKGKKISVAEGLVNGSNIELALDGNKLWIGTFEGISIYDLSSKQFTNFKEEIYPGSAKVNANNIIITDEAVYMVLIASAYSPGGIARYDKATSQWKVYSPSDFGTGNRVDIVYGMKFYKGYIFATDGKSIWKMEDKDGASWSKVEGAAEKIQSQTGDQYVLMHVIGNSNSGVLVTSSQVLFELNPDTGEINRVYPQAMEGFNIFAGAPHVLRQVGKKLWMGPILSNNSNPLIGEFDTESYSVGELVSLKDRPLSFYSIAVTINGKPLVAAAAEGGSLKLMEYSPNDGSFKVLLSSLDTSFDFYNSSTEPILGTNKIFIFSQICGQGCGDPKFILLNYEDNSVKTIDPDEAIKTKATYSQLPNMAKDWKLIWRDNVKGKFAFQVGDLNEKVILDANSGNWQLGALPAGGEDLTTNFYCNKDYSFAGGVFVGNLCKVANENENYKWSLGDDKRSFWQVDKSTGKKVQIDLPATPEPYSPFPDWKTPQAISMVVRSGDILWIGTNRGLIRYNPADGTTKLFDIQSGLIVNDVHDFVVNEKILWVSGSGFAGIEL